MFMKKNNKMNGKIVFLALALILFFVSTEGSTATYLDKRQGQSTFAHAEFDNDVSGMVSFVQSGDNTFIYGLFSKGLSCEPKFLIKDNCGNVILDVTAIFDVTPDGNGGTLPFFRQAPVTVLDLSTILSTSCTTKRKRATFLGAELSASNGNGGSSPAPLSTP